MRATVNDTQRRWWYRGSDLPTAPERILVLKPLQFYHYPMEKVEPMVQAVGGGGNNLLTIANSET
jgi:hypothetical protein